MVYVAEGVDIPEGELDFSTSRSSGPGGQNVNKVSTRVTLLWDVDGSPSLSPEQRERLHARLAGRINRAGVLRVGSQRHRTHLAVTGTIGRRPILAITRTARHWTGLAITRPGRHRAHLTVHRALYGRAESVISRTRR